MNTAAALSNALSYGRIGLGLALTAAPARVGGRRIGRDAGVAVLALAARGAEA